jgi:hypothetical protein
MKRQGASLPWSGTREATVSRVSISVGVGPGPVNSIGLTDRRVLNSCSVSSISNLSNKAFFHHSVMGGYWLEIAPI